MSEGNRVEEIRSYCAQCQSFCPIICRVENGKLVKITPDRDHPHATPLCPKGLAGPELVSDSQRLKYPLKRTRPKGDPDPGWQRISWNEAMETIARKLIEIRKVYGGHVVVFNRPGPGGSPARDYAEWVIRLAYAFGSPNNLATGHVCQWHRDTGSKYTYGDENVPEADYENTALLLIWGHNPYTSVRCNVRDIHLARKKGATLVVIDPRRTELAEKADLWLQVRPGTDGALILGLIYLLVKQGTYDDEFVRNWTNAPFLVREDSGDLLRSAHLEMKLESPSHFLWDKDTNKLVGYDPSLVSTTAKFKPALKGEFAVQFPGGKEIHVKPVFEHLCDLVAPYVPEKVESITGVPTAKIRALSDYLGKIKPASYYTYNGLEQHTNAMQTNRGLCILYALTGNLDRPGGNVFFPSLPGVKKRDTALLSPDLHRKRLAYDRRPLGPAGIPGSSIQAYEVFESILTGDPYRVKALVALGGNILTANSHSLRGREALAQLDFYVQTELFMTPSAELADIVLPAATFYESFHVRLGFPNLLSSRRWIQYRPKAIPPLYETRSDMEILFDLACRLGLGGHFWDGDIEKAFNNQLKPLGLTIDDLKRSPCGVGIDLPMVYEKYRQSDSPNGTPRGFKTSSRKIEIFSQPFKDYGYDPLPVYREPMVSPESRRDLLEKYPFILTCSKLLPFCHGQHRSIPSLRKIVPHPFVEIHPETARELGIQEGEWVSLETPEGKIRVAAKLTDRVSPRTVCFQHGWWQSCPELGLPGYDPFSTEGANANLLYSTRYIDPISGSVPYKAYLCKVSKIQPPTGLSVGGRGKG
jgi:anaerobic selenocysteine-containing dehydrogenase